MKHDDLWNDSLDDAMSPGLAAESLATMQHASRREARRRRAVRALALGVVCAAAALALWPTPRTGSPAPSASAVATEPQAEPVRYLSDDEFIARLNEAGYGVVITHHGDGEQVQLVPQDLPFTAPANLLSSVSPSAEIADVQPPLAAAQNDQPIP